MAWHGMAWHGMGDIISEIWYRDIDRAVIFPQKIMVTWRYLLAWAIFKISHWRHEFAIYFALKNNGDNNAIVPNNANKLNIKLIS